MMWLSRRSDRLFSDEVDRLVQVVGWNDKELKERAIIIAKAFLKFNKHVNPITLARASFYIALKERDPLAYKKIELITNNGGRKNYWWRYLVSPIEKSLSRIAADWGG